METDTVYDMFNKIVTTGNAANGVSINYLEIIFPYAHSIVTQTNPTRFLSRYDKSATNIKESLLFAEIGQVCTCLLPFIPQLSQTINPSRALGRILTLSSICSTPVSNRCPYRRVVSPGINALRSRASLTLQSQNNSIANDLVLYRRGEDDDLADPLFNPAAVLLGGQVREKNLGLAQTFVMWMVDPEGGKGVVKNIQKPGTSGYLYTMAPDCKIEPEQCVGWVKVQVIFWTRFGIRECI